ncbi:hypothetical protein P175DRAFT_0529326 [Aspergillus ochraceoroseus IBT 24754]|uniref:Receptor L-domain domain-containing protein n=2 Tax=Aspergillus ochraceoroseus TaxID=138278 RepID=A0A2T5M175_9EURO|nr:uncharacterized protein P175DRAFT_0529326 [Aspergillus ochraceoroseus IBT 24754]KKK21942.1 hypothetical protein AOCH_000172 [Aspergillus ochraceoroseus]PTU22284.1 hypothetical protein P175DRAFT_0529326 [Aspergillus ochraceoroseus IBT 24754]
MTFPQIWLCGIVLVAGVFPTISMGQECVSESGYFNLSSQWALDDISQRCTTLVGRLMIATNYTGPFILPNIKNITSDVFLDWWDFKPTPRPTSIELPDLESLGGNMAFQSLTTLTNLSMPKLTSLQYLRMAYPTAMDFRSLTEAGGISLAGNFSSITFKSLERVKDHLSICGTPYCNESLPLTTELDLSFPSLREVGGLSVRGKVSRLFVPELASVGGPHRVSTSQGMTISASGGLPLNLSFPQLSIVGGWLRLNGDIASLEMPSVRNMSADLRVNTAPELNVTFPFVTAQDMLIAGNISSARFPNLRNATKVAILSDLAIDCGPIEEELRRNLNVTEDSRIVSCRSTYEPSSGLKAGVKVAIGVVVGALAGAVLGGLYVFRRRRRAKQLKSTSSVELHEAIPSASRNVNGDGEALPPYSARPLSR